VEPAAAEGNPGKPQVLDNVPLDEWLLYFKIALTRGGMAQCHDEDAHGAARFMHRPFHGVAMLNHVKYLWLRGGPDVFAGKGVIRPGRTGGACNQEAGENGG
jgi:hypothetical protein